MERAVSWLFFFTGKTLHFRDGNQPKNGERGYLPVVGRLAGSGGLVLADVFREGNALPAPGIWHSSSIVRDRCRKRLALAWSGCPAATLAQTPSSSASGHWPTIFLFCLKSWPCRVNGVGIRFKPCDGACIRLGAKSSAIPERSY